MAAAERFAAALQEAAPLVDAVEVVVQPESDRWHLGFSDGDVMSVLLNEPARALTFITRIGTLPEANREQALEAMLLANGMWRDSGGVHMALGAQGELTQVLHCFAEIDTQTLIALIEDQREKADAWRDALPHLGDTTLPEEAPQDDGEYLRV